MGTARNVLVTGASRGIGLEYARQWSAAGHCVFALARDPAGSSGLVELAEAHPEEVVPVRCDVTDEKSVHAARAAVEDSADHLDVVINNAGARGSSSSIDEVDPDSVGQLMATNAVGPLRVSRAFLPLLRAGHEPRLIHMTSLMGSIEDNRSGGSYPYRMSKAALNMASRSMAVDLRDERILSVVLHPGWVRTDMGGPGARVPVEEAVAQLIQTIETLTLDRSGGFYDRRGDPLPW